MDLVHLKKDRTYASVYHQFFMEIREGYHDYIPDYTDDSRDGNCEALATGFPSNSVITIRLPDSAFIFTAEIWSIINVLEEIKKLIASKYIVLTDPLDWDGDTKVCLQNFAIKTLLFVRYPAILALEITERQTLLSSLAWSSLVPRLVYPIMILNISNILFPLGTVYFSLSCRKKVPCAETFKHRINQWNGAVTNKLQSVKPVLGDWQSPYRRCRKDEVVLRRARIGHTHLTNSYIYIEEISSTSV